MKKLLLISLIVLQCASTIPGTDPETVTVYYTPPPMAYKIIATVAEADEHFDNLIETIQEKAVDLGGNAFIVQQQGKKAGDDETYYILVQIIKVAN